MSSVFGVCFEDLIFATPLILRIYVVHGKIIEDSTSE